MSEFSAFSVEIDRNRTAEKVPLETVEIATDRSLVAVRTRGCFITDCRLTSPLSDRTYNVLYANQKQIETPKLSASHIMMPAGPSEGVGGQHGYPRWADYHPFYLPNGENGEKRIAMQAKRSDFGPSVYKYVELSDDMLKSSTATYNSEGNTISTSMGEHYYFDLHGGVIGDIRVDDKTIDELLGLGSEDALNNGETLSLPFNQAVQVAFPTGYTLEIKGQFEGECEIPMNLWMWHRKDSPSICFEPVIGVDLSSQSRDGVTLHPHCSATLNTSIRIL